MNEINPSQLLAQIRSLKAELEAPASGVVPGNEGTGFGALFSDAINQVNETQSTTGAMKRDFESGVGSASLAEVMIASQKADLSFRAMTEVRNKLVNAYQEIMNMPV